MNEPQNEPQPSPRIWPAIFITAFALGGVLWVLWMTRLIIQTRANRAQEFFVPMSTNIAPITPTPLAPINSPPARTNIP